MPFTGIFVNTASFADLCLHINGAEIAYGNFIQAVLNFLIMAFVVFCLVKTVNRLSRKKEEVPPPPAHVHHPLALQPRQLHQRQAVQQVEGGHVPGLRDGAADGDPGSDQGEAMRKTLEQGLPELGLEPACIPALESFSRALLEKNQVMNLTAITEPTADLPEEVDPLAQAVQQRHMEPRQGDGQGGAGEDASWL